MDVHCWAYSCSNTSADGFAMYEVPSDEYSRKLWLDQGNRKAEPRGCFHFCQVHFGRPQFVADGILRPDATPCLFFPSSASQSAPAPVMSHSSTTRHVSLVMRELNSDIGTPYGAKAKKKNISTRHSGRNVTPSMFSPNCLYLAKALDRIAVKTVISTLSLHSTQSPSFPMLTGGVGQNGKDLKFEILRRRTFIKQSYDAGSLVISCYFCLFSLKPSHNRLSDEEISSLHLIQSPSCPILTGTVDHVNVPDAANRDADFATMSADRSYLGITSQMAKYSKMCVKERRRATFLTFPCDVFSGDINLLWEAGYFYEGKTEGSVICFSCGSESANWQFGENPWQRHARTSPSCTFVIQRMGDEYVRSVLEEHGPYRAKAMMDTMLIRLAHKNVTPRKRMLSCLLREMTSIRLRRSWYSTVVQKALHMGLDKTSVRTVISNRIKRGVPEFKYIAELVRDVNDLSVPEQVVLSAATESPVLIVLEEEEEEEEEEESMTETDLANEQNDGVAETSGDPRLVSQQIISQLTCENCLSAIVGVIFLPCGHLVYCISCATAMANCRLCSRIIKGTVRANFANN